MRKLHLLISLMFLLLFISFSEEIIAEKNESGELDKVLERVNPDFYEEYKLANKNVRIITEYKEIKRILEKEKIFKYLPDSIYNGKPNSPPETEVYFYASWIDSNDKLQFKYAVFDPKTNKWIKAGSHYTSKNKK
ncbi:hypothetical protein [Piscibacillus salipiscarius]|uniref:DUF3887 domain-containing protein n=1 Tax=Piscibacillus salipiscarius TaxID=299480 RepID=A0ABW5Q903_9BACI